MENFDPDQYLASKSIAREPAAEAPVDSLQQQAFDPDQYLAQKGSSKYDALQSKYGSLPQQALAGIEGVARGATLGASDLAETKLAQYAPETFSAEAIKGRREANPVTAGLGNIGGAGALIGLTGGIAAPVAEGLGGGLAATAAGFGAEGGVFGAGNFVSDAALGDPNVTAQKLITDIGMGAALGAGFGVLAKGVESGVPVATTALKSSLKKLSSFAVGTEDAPGALVKGLSVPGSLASGESPESWTKALFDGVKNGNNPNEKIRNLTGIISDIYKASKQAAKDLYETAAPANIGKSLENMPVDTAKSIAGDTIGKIKGLLTGVAEDGSAAEALQSPGSTKIVANRLAELTESIGGAKNAFEVHDAMNDFAKQIGKKDGLIKWGKIPTPAQEADQVILRNINEAVRDSLSNEAAWGEAAQHYSQVSQNYSEYKTALGNFQKTFMRPEVSPGGGKKYIIDPSKVKTFFKNISDPSQDLKNQYLDQFINKSQDLAKASENYHGYQDAGNSISEHVSKLAEKNKQLSEVAEAMARKKGGPSHFSEGTAALAAHSLGIPSPIVGGALGAIEAFKAIKNPYQTGATLGNAFHTLKALGEVSESIGKKIGDASKSIFNNSGVRAAANESGLLSGKRAYAQHAAIVSELANNPDQMMDHLNKTTGTLYDAAPNVTQGIHTALSSAVAFLNSKLPRPMNQMPLSAKWEPSQEQKDVFNHYFSAVSDPISSLKMVKSGTLDSKTMEAIQAVHPQLLEDMRAKVLDHMNVDKARELPYGTKISLSKFLGQPLDLSMAPKTIFENQMIFASPSLSDQSTAKDGMKISQGGMKQMKIAQRQNTQTEDDEEN